MLIRLPLSFVLLVLSMPKLSADEDSTAVEFFEKSIRPALVEHCQRCHSVEASEKNKLRGGLLLDSRAGWVKGGDSGGVIVPGQPGKSLLIESLHYDGDVAMPPKGKLPDAVIANFEKWVELGAPDPRGETVLSAKAMGMTLEEGRKFWAFQPVANSKSSASSIDQFIDAKLSDVELSPAPQARREVLIRRIYFDLIGLPPTPGEIDAFVRDSDPRAYEKLVDRLLASPRFGERWGRHWLDVVRYAESVTLRGMVFSNAWRYRDYVIDAYNADRPFDALIREQIAGDLLPASSVEEKQRQTIATAFLALGNTALEEQDKEQLNMNVVDEQLDVISKGFLGQTVTCARCHDHKFDPIPTKDYYALAGILRNTQSMDHANVSRWIDRPMPGAEAKEKEYAAWTTELAQAEKSLKKLKAKMPGKASSGVVPASAFVGVVVDNDAAKRVGSWISSTHSKSYIGKDYLHDENQGKGQKSLTYIPKLPSDGEYDVRLAYSFAPSRAKAVPVTIFNGDGSKTVTVNMQQAPDLDGYFVSLGMFRFEAGGAGYVTIQTEGTDGYVTADAVAFVPKGSEAKPLPKTKSKGAAKEVKALEKRIKTLTQSLANRPMVMTVVENKTIVDVPIHIRGNVHSLGEVVPRGFLSVIDWHGVTPTNRTSGRLELAEWIASPRNPLTARVYANRVWHWLMGSGIVRSVDNFGTTGELPSHPALLDYLATRLVEKGWSTKALIREIVLSRTYQQGSDDLVSKRVDPENRLFGRANRRRLDAECIRDAMLQISGSLELDPPGRSFPAELKADYNYNAESNARSVYLPMFRNEIPELLQAFDIANPSMVTGRRDNSIVAPQALVMMNHPRVLHWAEFTAKRLLQQYDPLDKAMIDDAYKLILGRVPSDAERTVIAQHLEQQNNPKNAWVSVVQALFASADFRTIE